MAEYIEREALKDKLHKRLLNGNILGWLCGIINEQPAADVVPVVRCRYCKYHHWEQEPCHGNTVHICDLIRAEVDKDFFCAAGERAVQLDA